MKRLLWLFVCLTSCGGSSDDPGPAPASGANVYYLNFEGQSLTPGPDNPVTNTSSLVATTVTLPAYLAGDPQRAAKIEAIVSEVRTILSPYDIAVVDSRPASGSYDMLVAGGASQQVGLPAGLGAVAVVDCLRAIPRRVALLFDITTGHDAARQVVGSLGLGKGISASTSSSDCMCVLDGTCTALVTACSIGGANTPVSVHANCEAGGVTTMDVHQKFLAIFDEHP